MIPRAIYENVRFSSLKKGKMKHVMCYKGVKEDLRQSSELEISTQVLEVEGVLLEVILASFNNHLVKTNRKMLPRLPMALRPSLGLESKTITSPLS